MATQNEKLLPAPHEPKLLEPPKPRRRGSRLKFILWIAAILIALLLVFLLGYLPRRKRNQTVAQAAEREAHALPTVNVTKVHRSPAVANLLLPGTITPFAEAYLYARSTGYVKRRYADIGDHVTEGQLLAEVEAPDLDAQVAQARAQVAQANQQLAQSKASLENAQAQEDLARVTWERYRVLVEHGAVSRQEADQQLATYRSDQAQVHLQEASVRNSEENVRASQANLERMIVLQSFEQVRAPFTGVITARNFDVGALVSGSGASQGSSSTPMGGTQSQSSVGNSGASGSSSDTSSGPGTTSPTNPGIGSSGELYRIAQIATVRILVDVPQENAPTVRIGQPATIFVQEFSKAPVSGTVTRTSSSLNQTARTLLTEVDAVNPNQRLLPGMYAQVRFSDTRPSPPLLVPGDAVMQTANGLEVAILLDVSPQQKQQLQKEMDEENSKRGNTQNDQKQRQEEEREMRQAKRVHVVKVELGRDYGQEIEISSGLDGWEYVVVNPGDNTQEGALVIPRAAPAIAGENGQRQGQSEHQPSGIGSPSMAAPTQGPPGKGGGQGGKSGGKQGDGK